MDTEYMKTYPEGLLISETQMKTSVRFHITPVRRGYHKKRLKKTSTGKDVKKFYSVGVSINLVPPLWKTVWKSLKKE